MDAIVIIALLIISVFILGFLVGVWARKTSTDGTLKIGPDMEGPCRWELHLKRYPSEKTVTLKVISLEEDIEEDEE